MCLLRQQSGNKIPFFYATMQAAFSWQLLPGKASTHCHLVPSRCWGTLLFGSISRGGALIFSQIKFLLLIIAFLLKIGIDQADSGIFFRLWPHIGLYKVCKLVHIGQVVNIFVAREYFAQGQGKKKLLICFSPVDEVGRLSSFIFCIV